MRTIDRVLRGGLWIYLALVLLEGPLRKWILPGASNLFLVVRDPLVVALYAVAIAADRFPWNLAFFGSAALGLVALAFSLFSDQASVLVLVYGFRSCFLHLPLIFVFAEAFDRRDVVRFGRWLLWSAPPMAYVMVMQFRTSGDSWWNLGPGGTAWSQIEGERGKVRPPGIFSFVTGAAQWAGVVGAFLADGAIRLRRHAWWLLGIAGVALALATAVSVSRLLVGYLLAVAIMAGFVFLRRPDALARLWAPALLAFAALVTASSLEVFDEGAATFNDRLGRTGDFHRSPVERVVAWGTRWLEDPVNAVLGSGSMPWLGYGLGSTTNIAAMTHFGSLQLVGAEGEWGRMVYEMGPILGLLYMGLRVYVLVLLGRAAWGALRDGETLPLLLYGPAILLVGFGQWGQSTTQGFATLAAGLLLAAARPPPPDEDPEAEIGNAGDDASRAPRRRFRVRRGRRLGSGAAATAEEGRA